MFSPVLPLVDAALVEHFGGRPQRASLSFVGVEPIEVLRFEPVPGERVYVSLGMSRHPMTEPGAETVAMDGPRAELVLHVRDPDDRLAGVWRRIALLAAAPAVEGVVYRAGLSVDLGEPLVDGASLTGVVVDESPLLTVPTDDGAVPILPILPATRDELAWCRARGAAELRQRWLERGTDLLDLRRGSVPLG